MSSAMKTIVFARARRGAVLTAVLAATLAPAALAAQAADLHSLRFSNDDHRVERDGGRDVLVLGSGTAWLDDVALEDVVIEADMDMPAGFAFLGIRFRAADDLNHEYYYFRPLQSGREDATQYMPIIHGLGAWQIHTGPDNCAPLVLPTDRWVHVKLVAVGRTLEVYLDDMDAPAHVVPRLRRQPAAGAVGFTTSVEATRFADIRVRPATRADLSSSLSDDEAAAGSEAAEYDGADRRIPGDGARLVRRFRVSSPFAEERLAGTGRLDPDDWSALTWDDLAVEEPEGIANVARLHGPQEASTVFAAVTLTSDRARTVAVRLGFSDRVKAYLNGRPLFAAADEWASRDFRFLGIIGLHDTVYLPLEAGDNELWMAVSEDFGGWGVMLEVPDGVGVRVLRSDGR